MNHVEQFNRVSAEMSGLMTRRYSTSFSMGIRLFEKSYREPISSIYGFVRLADEIVDTFHHVDKLYYLNQLKSETKLAIERGFSINTILHSFAQVVNDYKIEWHIIEAFLHSMEMDIESKVFSTEEYKKYIYGSAEVVGLFCLKVFLKNDSAKYDSLVSYAQKLGSAFQKINFLRDLRSDYEERGRVYFPDVEYNNFTESCKKKIEDDIESDFQDGLKGIQLLPSDVKKGVFLAYQYYFHLFKQIKCLSPEKLKSKRVSVSNNKKIWILIKECFR